MNVGCKKVRRDIKTILTSNQGTFTSSLIFVNFKPACLAR
jgi:hypothetical protein